jgi:uncharacterized protein YrrD
MRKAQLVVGQEVYALTDGTRVETVKDVLVDETEDRVVGLLIDTGGLLGTSKVVPMGAISRFGPSAVMIRSIDSVVPASMDPGVSQMLARGGSLIGTRAVSEDGVQVGTIGDLYFDETSAAISGYQLAGVTVGDMVDGSLYLPVEDVRVVGPDAVIVSSGIVERARHRPTPSVRPDASEARTDDPDTLTSPRDDLVGVRLRGDLTDADGSIVAANGQLITAELVERAESEGNLEPLYAASGLQRGPAPGEQVLADAGATAADLWARFTAKLTEMTDGAGQRLDAQQTRSRLDRVNDAVGRPVTKVFLDRDDSVILDLGDLVTHQAIQRAADAGLLDSLLESVFRAQDVSFSRDEMRAGIGGHSAIDQASGGATVVTELEDHLREVEAGGDGAGTSDGADDHQPSGAAAEASTGQPSSTKQSVPRP